MLRMSKQSNAKNAVLSKRSKRRGDVRHLLHRRARALRTLVAFSAVWLCHGSDLLAQTPPAGTPHQATLTWLAPSPIGGSGVIAGYNVYKSLAGAAYTKVNTALIAGLTYTDSSVSAGQSLSYCATTVDSTASESACSIAVAATIPTNPNPPVIKITVASVTVNGATETVLFKWTDTGSGLGEEYAFSDGAKFLSGGFTSSLTESFAEEWTGPVGTSIIVRACNAAGICQSQAAM
jgi:hypothetical protein